MTTDPETTPGRRRLPTQQRSRDRVEAILSAAHQLIAENGSDAMTMSEVASRAGVPIGSVYQYFSDKPAILRELAVRFMERVRGILDDGLTDLHDGAEALVRLDALLDGYYQLLRNEPESRDVWAATQSDKELQRLDVEDSRLNGELLTERLAPLCRPDQIDRLPSTAFLLVHLAGAAVRLAIAVDVATGDAMMSEFRALSARMLTELLDA